MTPHAPPPSIVTTSYDSVAPSTPGRKYGGDFEKWFLDFSNTYNLNLRLPPRASPAKRKKLADSDPEFSFELSLYNRLRYHYFSDTYDRIEELFLAAAKDVHKHWVRKPLGESDTVPSPTRLPRAASEPERCDLTRRLHDILEEWGPLKTPSILESRYTITPQCRPPPSSPTIDRQLQRLKRLSEEGRISSPSFSSKKPRSFAPSVSLSRHNEETEEEEDLESAPPIRRTIFTNPRAQSQESRRGRSRTGLYQLGESANTSRSTFVSKVFDQVEEDPPIASQQTQTTVEASTQEKLRRPPASSDSVSDFAPSTSTEMALHTSFMNYEQSQARRPAPGQPSQENVRHALGPSSRASDSFSDFSIPLDLVTAFDEPSAMPLPPESSAISPTDSPTRSPVRSPVPSPSKPPRTPQPGKMSLEDRLQNVWPQLSSSLDRAPLVVRWEIMRIALRSGVDPQDIDLPYSESWTDQTRMRAAVRDHPLLRGKALPEKSSEAAWKAGLGSFISAGQHVVLTASLEINRSTSGPFFKVSLKPLKFESPHRLDRRFGSDRFLEIAIPSVDRSLGETEADYIIEWLVRHPHHLLGRKWAPFYIRKADPKKRAKEEGFGPEPKLEYLERVYLFAEGGNGFYPRIRGEYPPKGENADSHTNLSRTGLLSWLLQPRVNAEQPCLKLFSRIALGLSRTTPTVEVQPEQFRHKENDILSPTGAVMNDGIGRMSSSLARKVSESMGLLDVPAGFQGRIGSAKGVWIRDKTDLGAKEEDWIETYPSQRKWNCDFVDPDQRTFEVRSEVRELTAANLNLQFLPILQDRAIDSALMKTKIGAVLADGLLKELDAQRLAMNSPIQFRQWLHENGSVSRRAGRLRNFEVPFLAGLPRSTDEQMGFLLDGGFDPRKQKFLQDMAWSLRKDKCEELKKRLNIKVGRSTYAFMVVDFYGVLEEDEIHLGFSSRFRDEQSGFSETFLHGFDVLVARSPAHYVSDIQRVKAVFKPELGYLKDVVVFPIKGNQALADKLSGGDYDGDMAWVCWDPNIVDNFQNADVPKAPDLFEMGFLAKQTDRYEDLQHAGYKGSSLTAEFLQRSFRFNMQQAFLGMCTNWKERFCYARGSVRDEASVLLSTLLSNLVDQAKQGIVFTGQDWGRLKRHLLGRKGADPPVPLYRAEVWDGRGELSHINDYLKFGVAKPAIERELHEFHIWLNHESIAEFADEDLFSMYEHLRALAADSRTWKRVFDGLVGDVQALYKEWQRATVGSAAADVPWDAKVQPVHEQFLAIMPTTTRSSDGRSSTLSRGSGDSGSNASKTVQVMLQPGLDPALTQWALYKASTLFKLYYARSPKFVWWVAGAQLQRMKAARVASRPGGALPVPVVGHMYAGLRPDAKYAQAAAVRDEGRLSAIADEEVPLEDDV